MELDRLVDVASNGVLSTLGSKIEITYATKPIGEQVYKDLRLMAETRKVSAIAVTMSKR